MVKFFLLFLSIFTSAVYADSLHCKSSVSIKDPLFNDVAPTGDGTDETAKIQHVLDYVVYTKGANGKLGTWAPACAAEGFTNTAPIGQPAVWVPATICCPPPSQVFFPLPDKHYSVSSLTIHSNQRLLGNRRSPLAAESVIQGNSAKVPAVLIADCLDQTHVSLNALANIPINVINGVPTCAKPVFNFSIYTLSVSSTTVPVLKIANASQEFFLYGSAFFSTGKIATTPAGPAAAVVISNGLRGNIVNSLFGVSNPGDIALSIMNNTNALAIHSSTFGNTGIGNGINIGQSQAVSVSGNIFTKLPGYGMRVADPAAIYGGGVTTGLTIDGNRFLDVVKPISLGEKYKVNGATVTNNTLQNANGLVSPYFVYLGTVFGATISGNKAEANDENTFLYFGFVPDARVAVAEYLDSSTVEKNAVGCSTDPSGNLPPCYLFSGFSAKQKSNLLTINRISFAP